MLPATASTLAAAQLRTAGSMVELHIEADVGYTDFNDWGR